jgi:hypothetical protein
LNCGDIELMRPLQLVWFLMACWWAVTAGAAVGPASPQLRCGWFENPTPGNAWLIDREGEWVVSLQGWHQAVGDWPTFKSWRWVRTNGNYGYGCTCMRVLIDPNSFTITKILSSSSRSLATCRRDGALKEPTPG